MTTDSKIDALNVETNIHIALRLLRQGATKDEPYQVTCMQEGRLRVYTQYRARISLNPNAWHRALQQRYRLHPVIDKLIGTYRPLDWQRLVMEYPHQAESDRNRIAYTQTIRKGEADIQTVTSLGKYIARHFPQVPDHVVRDLVAAYSVVGCKIVRTTAEMIMHLHRGPKSCMQWHGADPDKHAYQVYCPTLGWGLAVREAGGDTVGRALVNDRSKTYVRTYLKRDDFSHSDHDLEAWLTEQGYSKSCDWEGLHLKYIKRGDDFLAPYLDGDIKDVSVTYVDGVQMLRIESGGDYRCDNTGGSPSSNSGEECQDCGERCADDDGYWVGRGEDRWVCDNCCDNNYTYAYSRNGYQYYIDNDNTVYVGGDHYDVDYLSDNNIVELHDGEYSDIDNAVFVESTGEYYDCNDDDVCYDTYNERYELREDCVTLYNDEMCHQDDAWQCAKSYEWYPDDIEWVEVDGARYHPDDAPQTESTTEGE